MENDHLPKTVFFLRNYLVDEYKAMFGNALNEIRRPYDIRIIIKTAHFIRNIEFAYTNMLHIT
jgi:hypothetical protein